MRGLRPPDTSRNVQLWLFTTTLTLFALVVLVVIAALAMAYLPGVLFYPTLIVVGAALAAGIAAIVRRHTRV